MITIIDLLVGGIEFGEKSVDAFIREIHEEIEAETSNIEFVGTIESIFTFHGEVGHEIVQVYDASFVDASFYMKDVFEGKEDDGQIFKIKRLPVHKFATNE